MFTSLFPCGPNWNFEEGLRQALPNDNLRDLLDQEIVAVEQHMAQHADDPQMETVVEGFDAYLCSLQYLAHLLHSDLELNESRLASVYAQAANARQLLNR